MKNNINIYNINFELDIYKAIMKCPFNINDNLVNLETINKLESINKFQSKYFINKNERNNFIYNFDYKKLITKNIYNTNNEYEKEVGIKY
jgi:hypothetical protein